MTEDKLREIVLLLEKLSTAAYQKPSPKFDIFQKELLKGKTDEEICEVLYGDDKKGASFRTLKHRYESQILNDLFSQISSLPGDFNENYKVLAALKSFTLAQALLKFGYRSQAISILESNFPFYQDFDFLEIQLFALRFLLDHYSYISIDNNKFLTYQKQHDEVLRVYLDELRVKEINRIFSRKYVESKGALSSESMKEFEVMLGELEAIQERSSSRTINFFVTDLSHFYYSKSGNHARALELSRGKLEQVLQDYPDDLKARYRTMINIALSLYNLGETTESLVQFKEALTIPTKGSRIWFHDTSLYYLILLRAKKYNMAVKVFNDVVKEKNLKVYQDHSEQWLIREAYLNLLVKLGMIPEEVLDETKLRRFSLGNFLNSVPYYTKDKTGQYISILIFKYFYYLYKKKYGEMYELSEGLYQYNYNYLNSAEHKRSFLFIKLLIIANKYLHDPEIVVNKASRTLTELKHTKFVLSEDEISVEIVPYEALWDILIKELKENS